MKTILITGGSHGIGKALVDNLSASNKYDYIGVIGRSDVVFDDNRIHYFKGDVGDYNFIQSVIEEIIASTKHIDVLVNNAGISEISLFSETSPEKWNEMLNTNINSIYNTCHEVVPYMVHEHNGRIINISSVWGLVGASCEVAYSTTKGAINAFTKALAKELAPSNISVNAIAFGAIDTTMNSHLSNEEVAELENEIPFGRMASASEAAAFIDRIIDMPEYFTGEVVKFDGAWI